MYQIFNPPSYLNKIVRHFWLLDVDSEEKTLKEYMFSYPYVNWVFTLGTPYTVKDNQIGAISIKDTCILGPRTNFAEYVHPKGNLTFGVTFQFGSTFPIFKEETKNLTNKTLLQEELFPTSNWLTPAFQETSLTTFIDKLSGQIRKFNFDVDQSGRTLWNRFIEAIVLGKHYTTSVLQLSKLLRVSQRHLQRITMRYSGLSPKQVQSMLRCRLAIKQILKTGITSDFFFFGFYDQNHFVKEVKKWSGFTPGKLLSLIKKAKQFHQPPYQNIQESYV